MFVISNNINTRKSSVNQIFQQAAAGGWHDRQSIISLQEMAKRCTASGADALEINVQQHQDLPEAMTFAVNAVQEVAGLRLCLSTGNIEALETGLKACRTSPLVNFISVDENRLRAMLPLVAARGAGVILLVSDPSEPADAREMLQKTAILTGAAGEAGIAADDIFVDPGLIHITGDIGQRHMVEVLEFLRSLPEATDPTLKSTCWLANSSAGAPYEIRPDIETALLPMLAGAGLSSVFLDALSPENMRAVRMIKVFNNELVYAESEVGNRV